MALTSFLNLYKTTSGQRNEEEYFKDMCFIINANINKFTTSEKLEILNIFTRMKIPSSSSKIINTVLKHLSDSLSSLTFEEICNLGLLMKKMPKNELNHKIQSVLSHKFLLKFATEFKEDSIHHLDSAFSFISCSLKDDQLLENVIKRLQNYKNEIPLNIAISILGSLCTMKRYPDGWLDVLRRVQNIILRNMNQLNHTQVDNIMHQMSAKVKRQKYGKSILYI